MGKLRSFQIDLDNLQGLYWAGQTVSGRATVDLESEMKMREIRLNFEGKGYVRWTESRGSGQNRHTVTYSATEYYFNNVMSVFGKGLSGGDEYSLPPGQHTFPFSFVLPPNLPSSFEGSTGHVRYIIKGTIDRPWRFDDHTVRAFSVLCALDLNQLPLASQGAEATDSKNLCCLCCKSGPIVGTLKVNRIGYVPGESIYFEASAQNMTGRECGMSANLEMITTFHATRKSRQDRKVINTIQYQNLNPGDSTVWSGDRFIIPPLPPSYLVNCNIIDIRYIIKLVIDPSGPAFDLNVPIEIIIGTVPLQSAVQQYQHTLSSVQPSAPPAIAMPAPSYNESILGPTNIKDEGDGEHTQGQLTFTPTYTYYNWSKTT
ncbi:arrestin domain-containing protein 3-like [Saccostrea echinata]|uniref:arrestin domain-containing protein 3-like n=1 Tax=Saccostrea echinata TaxID=191078 RepID=UPI002A8016FF|nr:arrestin domain-containing protein 3-like [Saccostrea echinata]